VVKGRVYFGGMGDCEIRKRGKKNAGKELAMRTVGICERVRILPNKRSHLREAKMESFTSEGEKALCV